MTVPPPTARGATIWLSAPTDVTALAEALAARLRSLGCRAEALDARAPGMGLVGRVLARNGVLAVAPANAAEGAHEPGARHEISVSLPELSLDAGVERAVATLRERALLPAAWTT